MACHSAKCASLLLLVSQVVSHRVSFDAKKSLAADLGLQQTLAVDPCGVLTNTIYVRSAPEEERVRQGRLQSLPPGSPFLRVGGLFWYEPYGICQVSEIIDANEPAVKARAMTGHLAKIEGGAHGFDFENILKRKAVKPLLPGSPIGTFFQTLPKFKELSGAEIETPPRTGSVTSEAWQDEESEEKFFVNVKYVDDGSTAVLEVGQLGSLFVPGVAIKTVEFAECSTASTIMGWQGDTSVKVKVTYYNESTLESTIESTIDLKGKIKDGQTANQPGHAGFGFIGRGDVHYFSLTLDPVAKPEPRGDAIQQGGLEMQVYGDSLQTFDYLRTRDLRIRGYLGFFGKTPKESFYAEFSHSSDIPLRKFEDTAALYPAPPQPARVAAAPRVTMKTTAHAVVEDPMLKQRQDRAPPQPARVAAPPSVTMKTTAHAVVEDPMLKQLQDRLDEEGLSFEDLPTSDDKEFNDLLEELGFKSAVLRAKMRKAVRARAR